MRTPHLCEERSDEAIQGSCLELWIASLTLATTELSPLRRAERGREGRVWAINFVATATPNLANFTHRNLTAFQFSIL